MSAKEVCDVLISQLRDRFVKSDIFCSFEVVDPKMFENFNQNFPSELVKKLTFNYENLISREKLSNELNSIYQNEMFRNFECVNTLFKFFCENELNEIFPEIFKVLEIVLTTPVTTAEPERCFSTLKRIKSFLRNSMGQERLNSLAVCCIHKDVIADIPNFNNRVIEMFAAQKDRRALLLFK